MGESGSKRKSPKDTVKPDFEGFIYVAEIQGRKKVRWTYAMLKHFKQRLVKIQGGHLFVEEDGELSPKNITRYDKSKDNNRIALMLEGDTRLWFHCLNLNDNSYNPNCVEMLRILLKKTDMRNDQKKDTMDTKIDNMETYNQNKVKRTPKAKAETEKQKPSMFKRSVLCAKAKSFKSNMKFLKTTVEIETHPLGRNPPKFLINGSPRTIKSFGTWKSGNGRFRISIKFSDKPKTMWFSLTNPVRNGDCDKECVEMLMKAHEVFPKLRTWDVESKIKKLQGQIAANLAKRNKSENGASNDDNASPESRGRRRLVSRYDNHFPPFVRTCQEILDALDDAGVDY